MHNCQRSCLRSFYVVQRFYLVLVKLENILNYHDNKRNDNSSWKCSNHCKKFTHNRLWTDISVPHCCHRHQNKIYIIIVETQGFRQLVLVFIWKLKYSNLKCVHWNCKQKNGHDCENWVEGKVYFYGKSNACGEAVLMAYLFRKWICENTIVGYCSYQEKYSEKHEGYNKIA